MAGMLEAERSRTRRDRTFIGVECAVCEEPLEHTLRGERVLQFSCGHVSHEACFYEFIKDSDLQFCPTCNAPLGLDTNRGGNVLDIGKSSKLRGPRTPQIPGLTRRTGKLSSIVRSVAHDAASQRSSQNTPTPWDSQPRAGSDFAAPTRDSRGSQRDRIEKLGFTPQQQPPQQHHHHHHHHARNESGTGSSADYADGRASNGRRHDYDVHAMESDLTSPRTGNIRNPIPPPIVTVRSEFPTLNRSRQQQSLTCLVTIEIPEGKWHPTPQDVHLGSLAVGGAPEDSESSVKSPPGPTYAPDLPEEALESLEEIADELKERVDNWHGLEFQRYDSCHLPPPGGTCIDRSSDSASCAFTGHSKWEKIGSRGRNWSVFSLKRCSSVSRRKRTHRRTSWTETQPGS